MCQRFSKSNADTSKDHRTKDCDWLGWLYSCKLQYIMNGSETSPIYQANSFPKRNVLVVPSIHAAATLKVAKCNCSLSFPKA